MVKWSQMPAVPDQKGPARWPMVVVPAIVALAFYWMGYPTVALVLIAIAAVLGIGTMVSPRFERAVHRLAAWLSVTAGALLGWLLLMPFYMLLMVPMAMVNRFSGGDRLQLKIDRSATSYWNDHGPMSGRYERPY